MYTYFLDIETSKINCDNNTKMQVTYLTNIVKMNYITGEICDSTFFRTMEETINYIYDLEECVIWSHNLDYELTFLLRELGETKGLPKSDKTGNTSKGIYSEDLQNIILRDTHSPLSIKLDALPHITFRDSYALFNKSVAQLGKELDYNKLDYDYHVTRLPWDELEEHDYTYNERDNLIVARYLYKYMQDNKLQFDNIPLTFTSFVKRKRKEYVMDNFGKKAYNKFYFDRNKQLKDFDFFELSLRTYQGGLTASNINETGKLIKEGVYSIDKKSSYPYQMVDKYYPFYDEKYTKHYFGEIANECFQFGNFKGFFGMFKFTNIRVKNRNYLLPISSSQMNKGSVSADKVQFNGKLLSASELIIPCNDVDIETIRLVYKWDKIECTDIFITTKDRRLRQEELSFIIKSFHTKETIKREGYTMTEDEELEYALSKQYVNGMYGVKVTAPIKSSYSILEGEVEEISYFEYSEKEREEFYNIFLERQSLFSGTIDIFTDGCYITSYARYELVSMMCQIVDVGCSVVYSDTDSIKFYLNNVSEEEVLNLINNVNTTIITDNINNPRFETFKEDNDVTVKDYEKITKLGIWEMETVDENDNPKPLPIFMTFGAKKYGYITHDNKVMTTIAGCNKYKPSQAIHNLSEKEGMSLEDSFKMVFAVGTQFDETASGRTVAKRETRPRTDMELLTYKGRDINQYGGIIIEDTTYTLNVSINDSQLLGITRPKDFLIRINLKGEIKFD